MGVATVLTEMDGRPVPDQQGDHQQQEQKRGASGIADPQRTIGEVGHRRACGGGRDDHKPVQPGMECLGGNLRDDRDHKNADEDKAADRVPEIQRHGSGIAAGFAERRREDLDGPEYQRDFRNLASFVALIHADVPCLGIGVRGHYF
jgi:hypothetical protein